MRRYSIAVLLAFTLGGWGLHRIYVRRYISGAIYFITMSFLLYFCYYFPGIFKSILDLQYAPLLLTYIFSWLGGVGLLLRGREDFFYRYNEAYMVDNS